MTIASCTRSHPAPTPTSSHNDGPPPNPPSLPARRSSDLADGNPLTAVLVSGPPPAQGTLALNANGSFGFTPALNFNGPATLTNKADDTSVIRNTAMATLTSKLVNAEPLAVNDTYNVTARS